MSSYNRKLQLCNLCSKSFRNLGTHLKKQHNILDLKQYYDKYIRSSNEGICPTCGKETTFCNLSVGYTKFCCVKCSRNNSETENKRKRTNLIKYGVESPIQNKEILDKIKQTNIQKYGVSNPAQSNKVKEKIKQTCINRYGTTSYMSSIDFREKSEQTCLEKYGTKYVSQNKDIKHKQKQTCLERYGVENPFEDKKIRDKAKQTMLDKYGVENCQQKEEIKLKSIETNKQNHDGKLAWNSNIQKQTMLDKYGVENIGQLTTSESVIKSWETRRQNNNLDNELEDPDE